MYATGPDAAPITTPTLWDTRIVLIYFLRYSCAISLFSLFGLYRWSCKGFT